ncbi:hypothetical protein SOVF_179090 [Spinacia oleracea]|uniref:Uncharacterized protein n=1 Tax=Spinacia oleracea TaxID=3562 RepID=A0ABM3RE84_SPIOL|nr:uncharacterized protein LOC110795039 [Spinacia oleracea]KNA06646.1 hypothetical protein SOVF_179090 [Spinacia oleracea]
MRGAGGPLLCIGDLLCDVGEAEDNPLIQTPSSSPLSASPSSSSDFHLDFQPSRLTQLFQENYNQLNKALAGTDHSWTSLTLKLCTALDTAKNLIQSANSNVTVLSENIAELEKIIKKEDSTIAEVRSIHSSLNLGIPPSTHSET